MLINHQVNGLKKFEKWNKCKMLRRSSGVSNEATTLEIVKKINKMVFGGCQKVHRSILIKIFEYSKEGKQ